MRPVLAVLPLAALLLPVAACGGSAAHGGTPASPAVTGSPSPAVSSRTPAKPARKAAPGCPLFPADSFWHADVSRLPLGKHSAAWVSAEGPAKGLKADFGSGTWDGGPIGIPITNVRPG